MKKVLIYLNEGDLAPVGGPLGYNFFLKQQLDRLKATNIDFIHKDGGGVSDNLNLKLFGMKQGPLRTILLILKNFVVKTINLYGPNHRTDIDLSKYDIVHFHTSTQMYAIKDSLKDYKGKVVLTTHSPTLQSQEVYERLTSWEKKYMHWFYKNLVLIDKYAFTRADYIIFPCPEAEEPYYNNWSEYPAIKELKKDAYRYLLTGTQKRHAKLTREQVCQKYNIPTNAFIVSYAGRHNSIKGYDNLKELGEMVIKENDNVYFLIAGKETPLQGLRNDKWIEVGWTDDPHSLIAASDVFVLPNRETYFDLILLEVLSLGTIVLASNTGGNKYFKNINADGVFIYEDLSEAKALLYKIMNMSAEEKDIIKKNNENLFEKYFTLEIFANQYLTLIESL